MLKGWEMFHLKGGIRSSVGSTFLYDIRDRDIRKTTRCAFGWWLTMLEILGYHFLEAGWQFFGRCLTIFWMIVDHPSDDRWSSFGSWVTIHGISHLVLTMLLRSRCQIPIISEHPWDGGWLSLGWWVGNHPGESGWPSPGWWVTILWKLGDQIFDRGWLSLGWWWPSMGWWLTLPKMQLALGLYLVS